MTPSPAWDAKGAAPLCRLVFGGLLPLLLVGVCLRAAAGEVTVQIEPTVPRPGDVVLLRATGVEPGTRVEWNGRAWPAFPIRDGVTALIGIDLDARAGPVAWRLTRPEGGLLGEGTASLASKTFSTQRLTLPSRQVDLDAATLARVRTERGELEAALADSVSERLWRGPFRAPVDGGRPTGGFGLRRVINGQPRSPHAGSDWAAPTGTPVAATNAGRVALVAEHFFAGRLVVLDHGLGLFTLSFHLDEVRVGAGQRVAAGEVIGTVGATGRATGPHLHLGVILGGARVDPEALLGLRPASD